MPGKRNARRPSPLREAREDAGLTQQDVAARALCSHPLISMAEKGYEPAPATQQRIAQALGASVGSFWPA